jgi:hypothetical protein
LNLFVTKGDFSDIKVFYRNIVITVVDNKTAYNKFGLLQKTMAAKKVKHDFHNGTNSARKHISCSLLGSSKQ